MWLLRSDGDGLAAWPSRDTSRIEHSLDRDFAFAIPHVTIVTRLGDFTIKLDIHLLTLARKRVQVATRLCV
jgi:hypothetical protein